MQKQTLNLILACPRGFCAGVQRAVQIVEKSIEKYGSPVYVRHEIVHNRFVVESLEKKGAVFVDELDEAPDERPVIFSAHGVPKSVFAEAERRNLLYLDATCPLVGKVHKETERHYSANRKTILIGHSHHPEVIGTMGQVPEGSIILVENAEQAKTINLNKKDELAYVTQTTLSVDETAEIIFILKERFPKIIGPAKNDVCYATTNRQEAVKDIALKCDALIVLGAPNSSNSKRLVEVAKYAGCKKSFLVQRAKEIDWSKLKEIRTLGITAGASAPEILVKEVVESAGNIFDVTLEEYGKSEENIVFKLPAELMK